MRPGTSPAARRGRRRTLETSDAIPRGPLSAVPSRVFGHALVVLLCLGVAYASQTHALPARLGGWADRTATAGPYPTALPSGAVPDALIPAPNVDTQSASPQRLQIMHYETQPGDTVAKLADRFDISENTIVWTNHLSPDEHLVTGQQLVILPVSGILYAAQPGDTVPDVARHFQSDSASIAQINQLVDPIHLNPGLQLIVPGGRLETDDRAATSTRSIARPQPDTVQLPPGPPPSVATPAGTTASSPLPVGANSAGVDPLLRVPFAARIAPPRPLTPLSYVVAEGDTLTAIAAKFGVSPESIAAASGLQGTEDTLALNQKLTVPPVPGVLHTVQDGDTLLSIAERYQADQAAIERANGLTDQSLLQIGQTLVVPGGNVPQAVAAPAAAPAPKTPTTSYTVQEGDSLSNIAASFGVDVRSIIAWNGLAEPYTLQPGQQVVIPGVTAERHVAAPQPTAEPTEAPVVAPAPRPVVVAPTPRPVVVAPAPRPVAVAAVAPARPAPAAVPAASSGSGWSIVGIASKYLGYAYSWGGASPSTGFDCSGFVSYVYRASGNPVPRDLWGQLQSGTRVSRSGLQPGDIVFFANTYEYGLSHDGIYIGGGRFIHAADYGIGVEVSSLSDAYWGAHYFGATRSW